MWWTLIDASVDSLYAAILIHAITNTITHVSIIWSFIKPTRVPIWRIKRGLRIQCGFTYEWTDPTVVEQNEDGNTLNHSFDVPGLIPSDTVWFYVFNLYGDPARECQGPLMYGRSAEIVPHQILFTDWGHSSTSAVERCTSYFCHRARKFTPVLSGNVATVKVRMYSSASGAVLLAYLQIRHDDAGEPSDFVQEQSTTVITTVPSTPATYTYDFSGATLISPGSYYWIIMYRTDRSYGTVRLLSDDVGGTPARVGKTGVQPWYPAAFTVDLIVES